MADAVRVKGLRELQSALRRYNKQVGKEVRDALKVAAEPVVQSARGKVSRFRGASAGTIGPRVTARSVFVTQRKTKVTGLRPDYGVLQMQKVLLPALDENQEQVVDEVEHALDKLGRKEGF